MGNAASLLKRNRIKLFLPKKSRSVGPTSHLLKRTLPQAPSLNYSVMQYFFNTKNKMHFDPVLILNHFVAPGVAEPSTMGGAKGGSLDKRIRSCITFFRKLYQRERVFGPSQKEVDPLHSPSE
ncbi:hypothetical protein ZWY2020_037092 [Hordeum vulgare]|nr:hypothetical protein ZWY2020_037092 [Hordeum vulgare]